MSAVKSLVKKIWDILKNNRLSVVLYLLLAALLVFVLSAKINVSLDEIYSYGLANYTKGLNLVVQDNYRYEPASGAYMEYVTATDRFNYPNVWQNQADDVHPPLYYAIVHTVCSLFPATFSIWYAGIINIFFSLLTLLFVQLLARELCGSKTAMLFVSAAFVLCGGILHANAFLRMYIMAMCQVTCISWLVVRQTGDDKIRFFHPALFAAAVAGALIHYYCIIYTVAVCGVYFICLITRRSIKQLVLLVATGAAAAAAAIGIFPAMIQHIFFSYRGEESFANLGEGAVGLYRYTEFFSILSQNLFGGKLVLVLIGAAVLAAVAWGSRADRTQQAKVRVWQYVMVLVPAAVYFVLVSSVAVYITNRYITPIYAVLLCGVISLVFTALSALLDKRKFIIAAAVFTAVLSVMTLGSCQKGYQYRDTQPLLDFAQQNTDLDCLYLYDGVRFHMMPSFSEVSHYRSVTFVDYRNEGFLWSVDYSGSEEMVLVVVGADRNAVDTVLAEYPQFTACDEIGDFGYATTYHLHG